MSWVVGWCQWYGHLVLLEAVGVLVRADKATLKYSPKRKYIGMKARGIMKKSKDRGIFSSIISYICP